MREHGKKNFDLGSSAGRAADRPQRRNGFFGGLPWLTLLGAWLLLLPDAGSAQEEPRYRSGGNELVEVRVVELDLQVVDEKGEPIAGLGQEDFELVLDGEPGEVEFFSAYDAGAATGLAADAEHVPSYVVVYVDLGLLEPGDLEAVRPHLEAFLDDGLDPEARVMLVAVDEELEVRVPFGSDRRELRQALRGLDGRPEGGELAQAYRQALQGLERTRRETEAEFRFRDPLELARRRDAVDQGGTGRTSNNPDNRPPPTAEGLAPTPRAAADLQRNLGADPQRQLQQVDHFHRRAGLHLLRVADHLRRLTQMVAGLPGKRHVIYLGNRLPTGASRYLFETWQREVVGVLQTNSPLSDESLGERRAALDNLMEGQVSDTKYRGTGPLFADVALRASDAGVIFHTVEVATKRRSRAFLEGATDITKSELRGDDLFDDTASMAEADGLGTLALITGGRSFRRSDRFDRLFARVTADLERRYSIGLSVPPKEGLRSVEVRLGKAARKRPGLRKARLLHRRTVAVRNLDSEAADRTLAALTLDPTRVYSLDPEANTLEIEIEAGVPEAVGEGFRLPVTVKIPLARLALLPDRQAHTGRLSIYGCAGDLARGTTPVLKAQVPVRIRNSDLLTSLGRRVQYEMELDLPNADPGRVAITVRDEYRPSVATLAAVVPEVPSPKPSPVETPGEEPGVAPGDDAPRGSRR